MWDEQGIKSNRGYYGQQQTGRRSMEDTGGLLNDFLRRMRIQMASRVNSVQIPVGKRGVFVQAREQDGRLLLKVGHSLSHIEYHVSGPENWECRREDNGLRGEWIPEQFRATAHVHAGMRRVGDALGIPRDRIARWISQGTVKETKTARRR